MQKATHIIRQQVIDVHFESMDDALATQNRVAALFYEQLQPRMELLFDELFGKEHYAFIDTLEIDCGILENKNWEQEWVEQSIRKIKEQLITVHKKEIKSDELSNEQLKLDLIFFLTSGQLPWNSRIQSLSAFAAFEPDTTFSSDLKKCIQEHPDSAKRIAYQLPETLSTKMVKLLVQVNGQDQQWQTIRVLLNDQVFIDQKKTLFPALLKHLASNKELPADTLSALQRAANNPNKDASKINRDNNDSENKIIFIRNAGMVILHPFLPDFFTRVGLWQQNGWTSESAQHTAVDVLELLVSGLDQFEEFNLPLNKILCGLLPNDVLHPATPLNEQIKIEGMNLLNEIIRQWQILKNTGIASLQETFLQRNGKLSPANGGWRLQVEQKGFDILLNSLPWGIGIIKLPWMKDIVYTEWNS